MKDRPILFTPENAQKCHEGTKTQTRRIIKCNVEQWEDVGLFVTENPCPYGDPGDRLWVREPFSTTRDDGKCIYKGWPMFEGMKEFDWKWTPSIHMPKRACRTYLEITEIRVERLQEISEEDALAEIGALETVTQEWVDDCKPGSHAHELATMLLGKQLRAKLSFMNLWESINGSGSWAANPWVWAITFKKVEP